MGMSDYVDRQIRQLSGGQQQRVFLARALVQEADIYLMDEPFKGVDKTTEHAIIFAFTRNESSRQNGYRRPPRFKYGAPIFRLGNDGKQTNCRLWPRSRYIYGRSYWAHLRQGEDCMTILQSYTTQMVLLGTALLGLASGIAGTFAVLRKESLIGDGLSHAALPGVVIAFLLTGIKNIEVLIAGAALSSITAAWLITITVENSKIKFDGALATILSAFFGLGMVLLTYVQSLNNAGQAGLSKFIFGQAATILARDVYITSAAALIIIVLTALFWKELKLISFDVEYAKTLQIPVTFTLILYRSLLIMTIIIGIQSVGAILISSLLIAPAVGARQWTNKLGTMCILAGFFGMISAIGGTIWSTSVPKLPTGPAIIVILSILVLLSLIFAPNRGMLWQFRKNRQSKHALLLETTRAPKSKAQQSIYVAEDAQPHIGGAP